MATESDLRDLLRGPDPEGRGAIDIDAVLSRARRRRRPRVIAAQALGSVAVIGALGTAIVVSLPPGPSAVTMVAEDAAGGDEAASAPQADESSLRWMPDACGAPVTDPPASALLSVEIGLEPVVEPGERIPITVTVRNDGPDRLLGEAGSAPHVSFSGDGVVLWHSSAVQDYSVRIVDLAPGESVTFETAFERVLCGSEDDLVMADPESPLPLAGPGRYEVRAVVVVSLADGSSIVASAAPLPVEIAG